MTFQHQPQIALDVRRCWGCGRYYAVETDRRSECPYCIRDSLEKEQRENQRLTRTIRSLRGAVTRLGRKGRRA